MSVLVFLACLISFSIGLPGGTSSGYPKAAELIFGGDNAAPGMFPMQVYIPFKHPYGEYTRCGGSLISTTHVLTAAHCAVQMAADVKIMVGSVNIQNTTGAQWRNVTKISVHPDYDDTDRDTFDDIAILEFDPPVVLNDYVKLSQIVSQDSDLINDSKAVVLGFGTYKYNDPDDPVSSPDLLYTEVTIFPFEFCKRVWTNVVEEKQLCAGAKGKGTGSGDSGGPIQVSRAGTLIQVGLTSYGSGRQRTLQYDQDKKPSVYTRVSYYCDFIKNVTKGVAQCL
ncbi:hypothetical protein QR680_014452 [Steinernema hermaphroditum]|uniref:Peptidase S1 domain-containing protein n=1 Tax=Steinernema hermaphroditum TaxID=289476 RepID=A0AA39IB39_9BILA|nr:hypothetical protein QR680_014452 [Steinernema hermaphroditum]